MKSENKKNNTNRYFPKDIEAKWQAKWASDKIYEADLKQDSAKKESGEKNTYYNLVELPYPSGDLHLGHWFAFVPPDAHARYMRMKGRRVLFPNGFDAFGLPAENAAIKHGIHPKDWTLKNIETMKKQFATMGTMIDWTHTAITCEPDYYKWNQWIFLKMFELGIAYRGKTLSNWCPKDQTVLANEHIENGKCWRCGSEVEQKEVEQWFLKITDFADELLWENTNEKKSNGVEWPRSVREAQNNWIGRSEGMLLDFPINEEVNYVLLHGFTGSPREVFFPWLKKELENSGSKVSAPVLPKTNDPDIEEQVNTALSSADFDQNTILLGHSLGSVVAMKLVEKLDKPIKKLVLVAGFSEPGFLDRKRVFEEKIDWKFDFEKIKKNAHEIVILHDNTDKTVPKERAEKLRDQLSGNLIYFEAVQEHVTAEKEPVVLVNVQNSIRVFTTRPDTTDGATFVVLAPEHELVAKLLSSGFKVESEKLEQIRDYVKKAKKKTELERKEEKVKTGVFTGTYAINPVTKKEIPIWISDYVLGSYGTGAIMAVPFADERDREFAEKFDLPIEETKFNAKPEGEKKINYHLRDWSISRQRYWGTPVPIIHCEKDGDVPVPYEDLPVELPYEVDYAPTGKPPLASAEDWLHVKCPECGGEAKRDAETLDTFFDSAWYFYRYTSPGYSAKPFDTDIASRVMPVDVYFGGGEHTLGHTLYARFFTKFFKSLGLIDFEEPFLKRIQHGVILGPDGNRMSKSRGNVVNPDDVVKEFGADTVRIYLCFMMPYGATAPWNLDAISGIFRFLKRVWEMQLKVESSKLKVEISKDDEYFLNKTIKKVGEDLESMHFNTAVSALMEWLNFLSAKKSISDVEYKTFIKLLAPFAPHMTEEIWHSLRSGATSLHKEAWPDFDKSKVVAQKITIAVQVNGKLRGAVEIEAEMAHDQAQIEEKAKADLNISKYLSGKKIKKVIYVKDKILSFVI